MCQPDSMMNEQKIEMGQGQEVHASTCRKVILRQLTGGGGGLG